MTEDNQEEDWGRLRDLLWKGENARLERLEESLDPIPSLESLSRALPDALNQEQRQAGPLATALAQPVTRALTDSVARDPRPLVDVMVPLLGPGIRRSIRQALTRLMARMNRVADYRLSPLAHYRAARLGVSLTRYVELEALVYRVERVLLVDRRGRVLLAAESHDCTCSDEQLLDDVLPSGLHRHQRAGDLVGLLVAVRGEPTAGFAEEMSGALAAIEYRHGDRLRVLEPQHDLSFLKESSLELERLLNEKSKELSVLPSLRLLTLGLAVLAGLFWVFGQRYLDYQRRHSFLQALAQRPGVVLCRVESQRIYALRDPLAGVPNDLAAEYGYQPEELQIFWRPYQSLQPALVKKRVVERLEPPPGVQVELQQGVVKVTGAASALWASQARVRAATVAGVRGYDDSELERGAS